MAVYATAQDMIDRFEERELVQLTDRHDTGAIDSVVLEGALGDADAKIDSYLVGRYALPLAAVPKPLKLFACDIARYLLHDNHATEQVTKRYDDAIRFLERVAKGDISIGATAAGTPPAAVDGAQVESAESVFKRDNATGFI